MYTILLREIRKGTNRKQGPRIMRSNRLDFEALNCINDALSMIVG